MTRVKSATLARHRLLERTRQREDEKDPRAGCHFAY